jgi:hypothetical protein
MFLGFLAALAAAAHGIVMVIVPTLAILVAVTKGLQWCSLHPW